MTGARARACDPWTSGYDRDRYGANGRNFWLGDNVDVRARLQARRAQRHAADARLVRQRLDQMLRPIDDSTDRINADRRATRASTGSRRSATSHRSTTTKRRRLALGQPVQRVRAPAVTPARCRSSPTTTTRRSRSSVGVHGLPVEHGRHRCRPPRRAGHAGAVSCRTRSIRIVAIDALPLATSTATSV